MTPVLDGNTRVSLQNILFATDFSSASEAALHYALSVARSYDSQVYVAHVIRPDLYEMVPAAETGALQESARRHAEEQMTSLLVSGRLRGVPHQILIAEGALWLVVSELIEKHHIDLVVVGTHGRTGAKKLLLGSAAEEIFRLASCPVLTVGPKVSAEAPAEVKLNHILYATDFSSHSERAAAYAFSLAQEHQAQLTLLHVVDDGSDVSPQNLAVLKDFFTRRLRGLIPPGVDFWCEPEVTVEFAVKADGILKVANERSSDLILLGIRRSGNFSGHLPPATAYKVVCQSHCPVLTIRG